MSRSSLSIGIIPVFISHMGCPNDCTFCNQRKITGHQEATLPNALHQHVMQYIETMKRDQVELAFFGGSFTGIEQKLQEEYLSVAMQLKKQGIIHKIRLSTRPDYIDDESAIRLKAYGVDLVELGCQSFDDTVLSLSKRGHLSSAILNAVSTLKRHDIKFGIQLMLGLPGDSYSKFMEGVCKTVDLDPSCVRLYPALVIKNTELADQFLSGFYTPMNLDDAISWTAEALIHFERHGINVIRVGLQRTDLIDFDGDVLAGPFHPSFGELVRSKIAFDDMLSLLDERSADADTITSGEKISAIFEVNDKQLSVAIGNKGKNKKALSAYLRQLYPHNDIILSIKGCPEVPYGEIKLIMFTTCGERNS